MEAYSVDDHSRKDRARDRFPLWWILDAADHAVVICLFLEPEVSWIIPYRDPIFAQGKVCERSEGDGLGKGLTYVEKAADDGEDYDGEDGDDDAVS